jgi:hypothetical protein
MSPNRKVYLIEEGIFADLISHGLYASRIKYIYGGVEFDVMVENDEFIELDDEGEEEDFWKTQESFEE